MECDDVGEMESRYGAIALRPCDRRLIMPRKRPFPPRPDRRFRIGCVQWNIENVAAHVRSGFAPVSEATIRAHYFRYLEFLQQHGFADRPLCPPWTTSIRTP
jgi:hypothetical protein